MRFHVSGTCFILLWSSGSEYLRSQSSFFNTECSQILPCILNVNHHPTRKKKFFPNSFLGKKSFPGEPYASLLRITDVVGLTCVCMQCTHTSVYLYAYTYTEHANINYRRILKYLLCSVQAVILAQCLGSLESWTSKRARRWWCFCSGKLLDLWFIASNTILKIKYVKLILGVAVVICKFSK